MLKAVKQSVHRMTGHLQLISGYLEMKDYTMALRRTKETVKEMHLLEVSLTGLANVGMTVPEDGAVVVPHGSCARLTRVKSASVTGTIIRRRSED
jgi:hypothetical protein